MRIIATIATACVLSATLCAQGPDFTPQTPLIGALLHNDRAEAKRLLERDADPNEGRFIGMAPVVLAIVRQDLDLVRLMAARGADLSVRDRSGSTALMRAAFSETGDAAVLEELLSLGADPQATNQAGETALDWALRRGDTPAVAALRNAGVSQTAAMKASIEKSIALLQTSSAQFSKVSGCYSCHHQLLPQMALGVARTRGLRIDEPAAHQRALVALQTAGHAVSSAEYQRGMAFLMRTQFPDGSWLVRTRTFPVQPPRDSGFPHGKNQWISAAGTSWATMALALALPPQPATASTQP